MRETYQLVLATLCSVAGSALADVTALTLSEDDRSSVMVTNVAGAIPLSPTTNESLGGGWHSPEERAWTLVELCCFLALGLFGNGLLLAVFSDKIRVARKSGRQSFANHTILALAVGDLLLLIVTVPVYLVNIYRLFDTVPACVMSQFLVNASTLFVHLILTVAVPMERLVVICWQGRATMTLRHAFVLLAVLVVVSLAVASPLLSFSALIVTRGQPNCVIEEKFQVTFGIISLTVGGTTTLFMVCCYAAILRQIWLVKRGVMCERNRISAAAFAKMTSVVWMMFVVTVIYLLAWMPYIFYQLGLIPGDYRYRFLYLLNNATNFIVYGVMSPRLRAEMWGKLTCLCRRSKLFGGRQSTATSSVPKSPLTLTGATQLTDVSVCSNGQGGG